MFSQYSFYIKYKVLEDLSNPPPSTSTAYGKLTLALPKGLSWTLSFGPKSSQAG